MLSGARNAPPKPLRWYGVIVSLFVMIIVMSIPMIIKGVNVRQDVGRFKLLSGDMVLTRCTLLEVQVVQCNRASTHEWVAVYKRAEDGGGSVVSDAYAFHANRNVAERFNYALNQTYDCMCHPNVATGFPNVDCDLTQTPCLLNTNMTRDLIDMGAPYGYASMTLIAIGSLLLSFGALGIILLCMLQRWCLCCCYKDENISLASQIEIA
jgi:hypothetical protein